MTAKLSPSDKVDDIMGIFELFDNDASGSSWGKRLHAGGIFKPEWASHLNILSLLLESTSSEKFRRNDIANMVDSQSLRVFCEC